MKILHCEQPLGTQPGTAPVTLLTDSSMSRNHRPLFVPPHHDQWIMTVSPVVRVSRLGKFVASKFARRYYDAVTLMARLRPATPIALPASATETAFDSSVVAGDWIEIPIGDNGITLDITGTINRTVTLDRDIVNDTLAWLSSFFMIKHGDIIVPGDLPDIIEVSLDTAVNIKIYGKTTLDFKLK